MRKAKISLIILLVLASLTNGCDKRNNSGKSAKTIQDGTTVRFDGYIEGCEQNYDPIFCADKYNPKSLNAGEEINATKAQYEDNTSIILNKKDTK